MPDYKCERCGHKTQRKSNLISHLNKKNECEALISDISRETCLQKLKKQLSTNLCKYCNCEFSTVSNKRRHQKNCKMKKERIIDEKNNEIEKLRKIIKLNDSFSYSEQDEFIYILQEREFIRSNQPIYKIGKTINPKSRLSSYPNGSRVYLIQLVEDCNETEKKMIELFDEKFENKVEIGREYYYGEIRQMIKEFKKMEE